MNGDRRRAGSRRLAHLAALLTLSATVVFLHEPAFGFGWHDLDEILLLLEAQCFAPHGYFFRPEVYRLFSAANLTPWAILSFDFDLFFFGLNKFPFQVHHLADIVALVSISYLFLSRWCRPLFAWTAALVFAVSSPMATASTTLPMRHYLEGGILALVSLWLALVSGEKSGRARWILLAASAALYAAAVTAKEIYVPVVVVLFVLARGSWLERLRKIPLHAAVCVLYGLWRWMMLGEVVGGYRLATDVSSRIASWWNGAWFLLASLPDAAFPSVLAGRVFVAMLAALLVASLLRGRLGFVRFAVILACTFGPIAPVGTVAAIFGMGSSLRYFLVPLWVGSVAFAFAVDRISSRKLQWACVAIALLCVAHSAPKVHTYIHAFHRGVAAQLASCIDFAMASDADRVLALEPKLFLPDAVAGAVRLHRVQAGHPGAEVLAGPLALPERFAARTLFVHDSSAGFVEGASSPCFARDDSRHAAVLQSAKQAKASPAVSAQVQWGRDDFAWTIAGPAAEPFLMLVRSPAGSFGKPGMARTGTLREVRQQLWLHRVKDPAEIVFAWPDADGTLRYTAAIDVPAGYFDFWSAAACD